MGTRGRLTLSVHQNKNGVNQLKRLFYLLFLVVLVVIMQPNQVLAQNLIPKFQRKVQAKVTGKVTRTISAAKGGVRQQKKSTKRALKSSLKSKAKGGIGSQEPNPVLDELIEDPEVKEDLSNNTNKGRYVELFGQWTMMPNDAELAARAKAQAFQDSINAISIEEFRVTRKVWDGSRDMILFGWHPHWMGNMYKGYNYNLLNVVSFYSYDINPDNGSSQNPEAIQAFLTGDFVQTAHDKGCSALLSISCHGEENMMRFLDQNPMAQRRVIDSILYILDSVDADGVEINFDGVNDVTKNNFYKFVRILSNSVTAMRGDTSFIFMSVPPYDPSNYYDIGKLQEFVDIFIVKGFDMQETPKGLVKMPTSLYNYSSVAPDYDLRSAVEKYIGNIGPFHTDRIILGLPYYGTMWKTDAVTDEVLDMSLLTYSDIQFEYVMQIKDIFKYPGATMYYDSSKTTYVFRYLDYFEGFSDSLGDVPHNITIYYDDTMSLRKKYRFIKDYRLGGVGIQSLGYDSGFDHLETIMAEEFTTIEKTEDRRLEELSRKSTQVRSYGIYFLVVLMYLSIFLSIGFCAALFKKDIRQALFDKGNFRIGYLVFFTMLILLLGFYMGLFETTTMPLLLGILVGGLVSWLGWRFISKRKAFRP